MLLSQTGISGWFRENSERLRSDWSRGSSFATNAGTGLPSSQENREEGLLTLLQASATRAGAGRPVPKKQKVNYPISKSLSKKDTIDTPLT